MVYCEACGEHATVGWEVQDRRGPHDQFCDDLVVCDACYNIGLLVQPNQSFVAYRKINGD